MRTMHVMQIFIIYFILYLSLNIMVVALEKGQNNRYQAKLEPVLTKPVYAFVKTDKHANIKWGVRHYVPRILRRVGFKN